MGRYRIFAVAILSVSLLALTTRPVHAQNRANPAEIPAAMPTAKADQCLICHRTLRGPAGLAVLEWQKGVHAKHSAACNICHGGNPDLNDAKSAKDKKYFYIGKPSPKENTEFCGRGGCHQAILAVFEKSPHYASVKEKGEPNCISCHGYHNVQPSTVHIISEKGCAQCHPVDTIKNIITALVAIDRDIREIEKNIEYLRRKNAESGDLAAQLADAKILFSRIVHAFSSEDIQFRRKEMEITTSNLKNTIHMRVMVARRLDLLYLITAVLGFGMIIFFSLYAFNMYSRRRK